MHIISEWNIVMDILFYSDMDSILYITQKEANIHGQGHYFIIDQYRLHSISIIELVSADSI